MKLFLVVVAFCIIAHAAGKKYLIETADKGRGSHRRRAADSKAGSIKGKLKAGAGYVDTYEGKADTETGALFTKIADGSDLPECQDEGNENSPRIEECWKVSLDVHALLKLGPNDEVQFSDQEPAFKIKMSEDPVPLVYHVGKDSEEEPYGATEYPIPGGYVDGEITFDVLEVAAIAAKKLARVSAVSNNCSHAKLLEVMDVASQVVAGTNYQLTLKLNTKSGPNCENLDTRVCSNVVAHKSLPHYCFPPYLYDQPFDRCIGLYGAEEITCTADGGNDQGSGKTFKAFNEAFTDVETGQETKLLVASANGGIDVSGTARWKNKVFIVKPCSGKDCIVMYWRKPDFEFELPYLDFPKISGVDHPGPELPYLDVSELPTSPISDPDVRELPTPVIHLDLQKIPH